MKYNEILIPSTFIIDCIFPHTVKTGCDNVEIINDTTTRINCCMYIEFTEHQKSMYKILLDIIKEVNFDAFIDLKRKLFFFNDVISNDTERSTFRVS